MNILKMFAAATQAIEAKRAALRPAPPAEEEPVVTRTLTDDEVDGYAEITDDMLVLGELEELPPPGDEKAALDFVMAMIEAVIRRSLFDNPEAVTRVMTVASAQLDAHVAAGKTIQPAVVRDTSTSAQRAPERSAAPGLGSPIRQGRDHKPQERSRSR